MVVGGGWLMGWAGQVGEWVALGRLGVGSEKNGRGWDGWMRRRRLGGLSS